MPCRTAKNCEMKNDQQTLYDGKNGKRKLFFSAQCEQRWRSFYDLFTIANITQSSRLFSELTIVKLTQILSVGCSQDPHFTRKTTSAINWLLKTLANLFTRKKETKFENNKVLKRFFKIYLLKSEVIIHFIFIFSREILSITDQLWSNYINLLFSNSTIFIHSIWNIFVYRPVSADL